MRGGWGDGARAFTAALVFATLVLATLAFASSASRAASLPGIAYRVLASGPAAGPHPTRADRVAMRYVGTLADGAVFSTSPQGGAGTATFEVKGVIPGMSAALQLMRPGDRWRIVIPSYLAYGPGRAFTPPAEGEAAAVQQRDIPPQATLTFMVELVAILPGSKP